MLAKKAGVSVKTIQRALNEIDDLRYVGSGYSGHWEKTGTENVPQDVPQDVPQGDIKIFLKVTSRYSSPNK